MEFAFFTCLDPLREFFHSLEGFGFWVALGFGIIAFLVPEDEARKATIKIFLFGLLVFFVSRFVRSFIPTTENMLTSCKIELLVKDGKNEQAVKLIDERLQKNTKDKEQEEPGKAIGESCYQKLKN